MENFTGALDNAKRMIAFYNNEISKLERKIELYTIAQEFEEAKRADNDRKTDLKHLAWYEAYLKALEFYMEHNLQEA